MPLTASHWDIEARKYGDVFAQFNTPAKFHAYFAEFVETGEALREFIDYFDTDKACQQAVERAFALRVGALREAIRALHTHCVPT